MLSDPICLRVKGPFACFTRPEFHVERVSYPIITPSAARGILEAILMKPIEKPEAAKRGNKVGFHWRIMRLGIVREGTLVSILRNELGYEAHQAYGKVQGYDILKKRAQRHSLILRDVEYFIEARIEAVATGYRPNGNAAGIRPGEEFQARNKYHQMFLRRATAGQCYYHPFLGCREFSVAEWDLVSESPQAIADAPPEKNYGVVFRDFDFSAVWKHWEDTPNRHRPGDGWSDPANRPRQLTPLKAVARCGWISVSELRDGKVVDAG